MTGRAPMTEAREQHLIGQVATLRSLEEAHGFRAAIQDNETMGAELYRVLSTRIDMLAKRESKA